MLFLGANRKISLLKLFFLPLHLKITGDIQKGENADLGGCRGIKDHSKLTKLLFRKDASKLFQLKASWQLP